MRVNPRITQRIAFTLLFLATLIIVIPVILITILILQKGLGAMSWEFLTKPPRLGMRAGGIFPAIVGTIYLVGGTMFFALPVGILAAIYLSEYARLTGAGGHPVADRAAVTAELDRRAGAMKLNHLGGTASIAGDFVFTYGSGEWSREGEARTGHYVRIWQKGADGWRLATETLIATPLPPPPEETPQNN